MRSGLINLNDPRGYLDALLSWSARRVAPFRTLDAGIALLVTSLCSLLVYHNLGNPALTGIDDENIVQVYGRNLANGFGYVYTPHFEHVEGATSPLWVAIHYALFKVSAHPEPYILAISAWLGVMAVYLSLGIARSASAALALPRWALWIPVLAIAAQPDYFAWTVVTLMDQGLWSTIFLALILVLIREVSDPDVPGHASFLGVLLCILGMLTRPESMLVLPLMLGLAGVVVTVNKGLRAAIGYIAPYSVAVIMTLVALTIAREIYFGHPLPNTYYAKISSHPSDNIFHGLQYVEAFLSSNVLILPAVMAIVLGLLIAVPSLWHSFRTATPLKAAHAVMILIGGAVVFVVGVTVVEGGDHFAGFRMLQPYGPLLCIALVFYLPLSVCGGSLSANRFSAVVWIAVLAGLAFTANHSAFASANKEEGIKEEFTIARDGRRMGDLLNTLGGQLPSVGVLPAGGIAMSYNGRVADLLGLNWAAMAHGSGRRTGLPGHSAFNAQVFWTSPPDLMLPEFIDAASPFGEKQLPGHWELSLLKGLMNEQGFRDDYRPVVLHLGGGAEVFAYARVDFLQRVHDDPRVVAMSWERLRPIPRTIAAAQKP